MSNINRKFFFEQVRSTLFGGKLKAAQVGGLGAILDYWEAKFPLEDDRYLAYILATAHHETDSTIQPIKEYGTEAYFKRKYDITGSNPALARRLGNIYPGDGARYAGRGFVQLTGRRNYKDWSRRLSVDMVWSPDMALRMEYATPILLEGMLGGTFTGKKLADYFSPTKEDWVGARRIINGTDKAQLVAGYAKQYYAALSYTS